MKFLKYLGYTIGVVVLLFVLLIAYFAVFPAEITSGVIQTLTVGGKTVYLARSGPGEIKYSASMEDGGVTVNGVRLDLSGGDVFTVLISADGKAVLKPGKP